jgi:hypothetical protein
VLLRQKGCSSMQASEDVGQKGENRWALDIALHINHVLKQRGGQSPPLLLFFLS